MGIKELRIARGMTQAQLAEKAGMAQQRVSLIEKGLRPEPHEIKQLARALHLPVPRKAKR